MIITDKAQIKVASFKESDKLHLTTSDELECYELIESDLKLPADATFTRSSVAYLTDGTQVAANTPRFEQGRFGKAVMVEEGTTNIFKNPLAKDDLRYWYLDKNADSIASMTRITNDGVFGNTCVECTRTKLGTLGWIVFQQNFYQYASQPYFDTAKQYTLSFYAKSVSGSNIINVSIKNSNGLGPVLNTTVTLTNNWQRYVITFTPLISGEQPVLYITTNTDNTTFRITAIQIEQKPYATSFVDGTRAAENVSIPTSGILNPQEGTIEFWVKLNTLNTSYNPFFSTGISAPNPRLLIMRDYAPNKVRVWDCDGNTEEILTGSTILQPNVWYYIAFVWSPAGRKLFINGICEATNTRSQPIGMTDIAYIGGWGICYLNGLIDDLRISNRARSDEEILAAYQSGKPLPVDEWTTYKLDFDDKVRITTQGQIICNELIEI